MTRLKDLNIQKSLSVVKDFHDAIVIDERDPVLKEKKKQSENAVAHLFRVFGERRETSLAECTGPVQQGSAQPPSCTGCVQQNTGKPPVNDL